MVADLSSCKIPNRGIAKRREEHSPLKPICFSVTCRNSAIDGTFNHTKNVEAFSIIPFRTKTLATPMMQTRSKLTFLHSISFLRYFLFVINQRNVKR